MLFDNNLDVDELDIDDDDVVDELYDEQTRSYRRNYRRIIIVNLNNDTRRMTAKSKDIRPLFIGGEELSGKVSIEVFGGKPIKQVKIALVNLMQIRWCNKQQQRRRSSAAAPQRRKSIFTDYFGTSSTTVPTIDDKQLVFDRKRIIELDLLGIDKTLTEGRHEIPFRFILPKSGPSSLKSCRGLIKYTVEAFTFDEDGHESRGEKEILLLIPNLDVKRIERKVAQTFITNDGNNVDISVMLDRKIYQPGEMMSMTISIRNESDSTVECLVALYQRQTLINNERNELQLIVKEQSYNKCLNDSPSCDDTDEMSQAVMIPIDGNSQLQDEPIQMRLPNNIVLSLDCPLMTIHYYVLITISIPDDKTPNQQRMEIPFLVSLTSNQFGHRIASQSAPAQQLSRQISR